MAGLLYMQHVHILFPRSLIMKLSFMCCCVEYRCSMPILLGACLVQYIQLLIKCCGVCFISQSSLFIGRALGWGVMPLLLEAC